MRLPDTNQKIPDKGFYYHNRHDASKGINDCAYEVIGIGIHTEDDCKPEDAQMVLYRPLYDAEIYRAGKYYWIRPLEMWMGEVVKDGQTVKRFQKISDEKIITELKRIKKEMYGEI